MAFDQSSTGHRTPSFSVSQLQTYATCPHKYLMKYVRKRRGTIVASPAMVRGSTAHAVLGHTFNSYRRDRSFPTDYRDRIAAQLPRREYNDDRHWQSDIDTIATWIDTAVTTFDTASHVVAVERVYDYHFPGRWGEPAFTLTSRIDLVIQHDDAYEHIDWKTGRSRIGERLQNIASRITLGKALQDGRIQSTTTLLALGSSHTVAFTRHDVRDTWEEIKDLAQRIIADDDWEPVENPLCPYCPYRDQGCPLMGNG